MGVACVCGFKYDVILIEQKHWKTLVLTLLKILRKKTYLMLLYKFYKKNNFEKNKDNYGRVCKFSIYEKLEKNRTHTLKEVMTKIFLRFI